MQLLKEQCFVPFNVCLQDEDGIELQRPYIPGSSLSEYVLQNLPLCQEEMISLSLAIANNVKRLHQLGVILKTLQPNNIIIRSSGTVRFVDVGYDAIYQEATTTRATPATLLFRGPEELLNQNHQTAKAHDIWCLGLCIYFIATGCYPFNIKNSIRLMNDMASMTIQMPDCIPPALVPILEGMLQKNPDERPNADQAALGLSLIAPPRPFSPQIPTVKSFSIQLGKMLSQNSEKKKVGTVAKVKSSIYRNKPILEVSSFASPDPDLPGSPVPSPRPTRDSHPANNFPTFSDL